MRVHSGLSIHKQEGNFGDIYSLWKGDFIIEIKPWGDSFSLLVRKDAPGNHGLIALAGIRENIWSEKEACHSVRYGYEGADSLPPWRLL